MRPTCFALLTAMALLHTNAALHACGDKFGGAGRPPSYQRAYSVVYYSRILFDAVPRAGSSALLRDPKFQATFSRAGHQVSRADNAVALGDVLKSGQIQVIIADVANADGLARAAAGLSSNPIVLPVMTAKPTKAETDACRAAFGERCGLKASDKPETFLREIDEAIRAREKALKKQKS